MGMKSQLAVESKSINKEMCPQKKKKKKKKKMLAVVCGTILVSILHCCRAKVLAYRGGTLCTQKSLTAP